MLKDTLAKETKCRLGIWENSPQLVFWKMAMRIEV